MEEVAYKKGFPFARPEHSLTAGKNDLCCVWYADI